MNTWLAYLILGLCSISFGVASVLEMIGTRRVGSLAGGGHWRNYAALVSQAPYTAGLALDAIGFGLFMLAVHALPLFLVQAADTASIAVTAVTARLLLGTRLGPKERWLITGLVAGLLLLAYAAAPEPVRPFREVIRLGVVYVSVVLAAAAAATVWLGRTGPLGAAVWSGLGFSGVAVAGRMLPDTVHPAAWLHDPLWLALVLYGMVGMGMFTLALQKGQIMKVYSITFVTETVVPALVGIAVLGDAPRSGRWLEVWIGLGIAVMFTGALAAQGVMGLPRGSTKNLQS